jgi:cytochrome oxidase assembly protein ShyY1
LYRDVEAMAKRYDTEPLMFQRISRRNGTGIPITGPPRIEISNRHMEYIITWYAMSAATLALGFLKH